MELQKGMKYLTPDLFEKRREIKAVCLKGDLYIQEGIEYTVRYMEKRNHVSVPLGSNPHMKYSNSGVEYSLKRFAVKIEEGDKK